MNDEYEDDWTRVRMNEWTHPYSSCWYIFSRNQWLVNNDISLKWHINFFFQINKIYINNVRIDVFFNKNIDNWFSFSIPNDAIIRNISSLYLNISSIVLSGIQFIPNCSWWGISFKTRPPLLHGKFPHCEYNIFIILQRPNNVLCFHF